VTNNVYYHGIVNYYHCDWLMTRTLSNPHAQTLLTIDSGEHHGRTYCYS
jgi:hypothetical protein